MMRSKTLHHYATVGVLVYFEQKALDKPADEHFAGLKRDF